jgi:uncharacterized membrane protein YbhN (UPF0104 family)
VQRLLGLNTLFFAVFGAGAWLAALAAALGAGEEAPLAMTLPWLVAAPPCFLAAVFVATGKPGTRRAGGRLGRVLADAIAGVGLVSRLVRCPRRHLAGILGAFAYWGGALLCFWAALQAFGVDVSLPGLVLVYATGYVANALPLPAGGAGAVDASLAFALTLVGVPLSAAIVGAFTFRFFTYWLPIVPALLAVPTVPRLKRDLGELA